MIYSKDDIRQDSQNRNYYIGKLYPNIPYSETDDYIITNSGDRLDLLAKKYYKNPEYWKIIAMANNNVTKGSMFIQPGTQIRIPINITEVLKAFNEINKTR